MAGSLNKKQKQDKSTNDDDEIGEEDDLVTTTPEGAFNKVLNRDHSDNEMDVPNSSPPASPASSENSTSTNQSGPHDVLLRVSEAHLALLADEDGDTPLHIAIIHEKLELVKHMVKTITGVYMNLDIANHMRQVCVWEGTTGLLPWQLVPPFFLKKPIADQPFLVTYLGILLCACLQPLKCVSLLP